MESCAGPDCFGGVQVVVEKQVERVIIQTVLAASSVTLRKSFNKLSELRFHPIFSIFIKW